MLFTLNVKLPKGGEDFAVGAAGALREMGHEVREEPGGLVVNVELDEIEFRAMIRGIEMVADHKANAQRIGADPAETDLPN